MRTYRASVYPRRKIRDAPFDPPRPCPMVSRSNTSPPPPPPRSSRAVDKPSKPAPTTTISARSCHIRRQYCRLASQKLALVEVAGVEAFCEADRQAGDAARAQV